jgi:uncharacterized membrane protein YgcG
MRDDLKAKRYDDAYTKGWAVAAALVREDYVGRAVAAQPAVAAPPSTPGIVPRAAERQRPNFATRYFGAWVIIVFILVVVWVRRRRFGSYFGRDRVNPMTAPIFDTDDANRWRMLQSSSDASPPSTFDFGSSGGDSGSSGGGDFGGGGGFSGGGSSDSI